jgi:pimeloyl-ACP methyl ester carboxylesterase
VVWFESDGAQLHALDCGGGNPIVFLHGGLADSRATLFHLGPIAASHRLLAPDLRGSGLSMYARALSWDQLADDVDALLGHLGIERAVVGGMSMGSAVALRFAIRYPHRPVGLVLMSPLYPGQDRGLTVAQAAAMRAIGDVGQRAQKAGIEAFRPLYERLPEPIRERAVAMMLDFHVPSMVATTRLLASCVQPIASARDLASIDVPVLVIPGADAEHPQDVAELYARHLRDAALADPTSPDRAALIASFCQDLPWGAP